jgi:putative membrane protein
MPFLPTLNASLNATCTVFLLAGFWCIRRHHPKAHAVCMTAAFGVSVLFLIFYLIHHALHGTTHFPASGWVRSLYLAILISHTFLAIPTVPLAIWTMALAGKGRLTQHKRLARWTLPIWLYVSATGVVVYWMLYRITWR